MSDKYEIKEIPPEEDVERDEKFPAALSPHSEESRFSTPADFPGGRSINQQRDRVIMDKTTALANVLGIDNPDIDPITISNYFKTEITPDGTATKLFYIKNGEYVDLTQKGSGKFYAPSTLRNIIGIGKIRQIFGQDESYETPKSKRTLSRWFSQTPEEIELQYIDKTVNIIDESLSEPDEAIYNYRTELIETRDKLRKIGSRLNDRESLKTKLKRLFSKNKEYKGKRGFKTLYEDQIDDTEQKLKAVEAELLQLKESHLAQTSKLSDSLRESIDKEKTLGERFKQVFKEKGLLIAVMFLITAIPTAFFTWLFGGGNSGGGGGSGAGGGKKTLHDWVKTKLKALASLFGKLASKAASALPSVLGSLVAGIFNLLKKAALAAANHVWAAVVGIFGIIGYALYDAIKNTRSGTRSKKTLGTLHSVK